MSKKITVYTTGSGVGKVIETEGVNWNQLKADLGKAGVSTSNMKAVIGKNKTNLEHGEALLPDEDFTLFLFPEKTRSGATYTASQIAAMPYKELRETLKGLSATDGQAFKDHFGNYTNKTTDDLKKLLASYKPTKVKEAPKGVAATKAQAVPKLGAVAAPAAKTGNKPERVKREAIEEKVSEKGNSTPTSFSNDDERINFIIDTISQMTSATSEQKDKAINAIANLKASADVKGSKSSSSFTQIDNSQLRKEAEDIRRGLHGIY